MVLQTRAAEAWRKSEAGRSELPRRGGHLRMGTYVVWTDAKIKLFMGV